MQNPNAFYAPLDELTLRRAQRGERNAFAEIYERYKRPCFTLAVRVLGEPAAAEDVVQEVFVRLFEAIGKFRGDAPFGAWLRRMVANATIDELRRRRWLESDDGLDLHAATAPGLTELPERQLEAWQMLMRFPPRARAVLVLHEVEGYTHKELGAMFGQSESFSKSILARALERLQGSLHALPEEAAHVRVHPA